jgi:hypothetical protein
MTVTTANGSTDINAIAGFGYVITGTSDTQIIITVAGVWSGTLKMLVEYAI